MINRAMAGPFDRDPFLRPFEHVEQLIPASLRDSAIALYTTRPQGLSDFALPLTNAVTNGDFVNTTGWTGEGTTFSVADNIATAIAISQYGSLRQILTVAVGDVLIVGVKLKADSNSVKLVVSNTTGTTPSHTGGNQFEFLTARVVATTTAPVIRLRDDRASGWTQFQAKEVFYFNLTTRFGLSNEPTSAEFTDMLTYKGKTFWNGTEPVVINPNDKYYWPDRSGFGRHLHAVNVAYDATGGVQPGPPANWLCDGVNDYLVYNSATDIVAANGAVSAFVVFQAVGAVNATHRIASLSDTTTASITLTATPTGISCVVTDSVSGTSTATATLTVNANQWYSVTFGYDTATKKAFISVNGGTISLGTAITNGVKKINKFVLASNANVSAFNNDRLAEFPVLNKSATQADCKTLHNNIASRYPGLTKV